MGSGSQRLADASKAKDEGRRRVALVGTGHRGAGTWGKELLANFPSLVDLVGLCDTNIGNDPWLDMLYDEPSREDGYFRDACVFREDIDIPDTMSAAILYESGVQVSYSLNTFMPIECYHLAFNGTRGRIEIRQYERQAWQTPDAYEILVLTNRGQAKRVLVPHQAGGHFGGDLALQEILFRPGAADPLGQRAGARAGAISVLCGIAAMELSK